MTIRAFLASIAPRHAVAWIGLLTAAGLSVVGAWAWLGRQEEVTLRIAAGQPHGTYDNLARALGDLYLASAPSVTAVTIVPTSGSNENAALLERGDAELGFVQNDTLDTNRVRTAAVLYEEVLHVLIRREIAGQVRHLRDLAGLRVSLGPEGSGTSSVAGKVLAHFGLTAGTFQPHAGPLGVALSKLEDGSLDAALLLSAYGNEQVRRACDRGAVAFLSLGSGPEGTAEADALQAVQPFYEATTMPVGTYGLQPTVPVRTVSVTALLATHSGVPDALVRELTKALYQGRAFLARREPVALRFRESFEPRAVQIPFHEGAVDYYLRSEPPLLVKYAETLSFLLGFGALLIPAILSAGAFWTQRRKDRIDQYYEELDGIANQLHRGQGDVAQVRTHLQDIRLRAFSALRQEQLAANESFVIFHDYLSALLEEAERAEARLRQQPPPTRQQQATRGSQDP